MQKYKFIISQLNSSDYILRVRSLQSICSNKKNYTNNLIFTKNLIEIFNKEKHPKVIRWFAYTFAIINAGCPAISALNRKIKHITDIDAVEWLIASIESLELTGRNKRNKFYPKELESKDDFGIGVIKSWGYKDSQDELMKYLISALSHSKSYVRKWAALSIGNKKDIQANIKEALKELFHDDDYLVREWAMYAVKEFANENDLKNYIDVLEVEGNARAREWAVKSLPYTLHRDVPYLLSNEIEHIFFKSDSLYAESVISAMENYSDYDFVVDKMISVINKDQDDLVILSVIKNLLRPADLLNNDTLIELITTGCKIVKNKHIKIKIAMHLIGRLKKSEKINIFNVLKNEIASNILYTLQRLDVDKDMISDLFYASIDEPSLNKDQSHAKIDISEEDEAYNFDKLTDILDNLVCENKTLKGSRKIFIGEQIIMGDQYKVNQSAAVGRQAHAENITLNQVVVENENHYNYDIEILKLQLELTRRKMTENAKSLDDFISIGEIARAENAINLKDKKGAYEHLKLAGKWALDIATQIGAGVAAEVIKKSMGI